MAGNPYPARRVRIDLDDGKITHRLTGDSAAPARVVLSLRPVQVPMTDEQIRSMCKQGWVFETVRQWVHVIEAHHGITAQAKKEGA